MCVCVASASAIDCVTYLRKFTPLLPWLVTSARSTLLLMCVCVYVRVCMHVLCVASSDPAEAAKGTADGPYCLKVQLIGRHPGFPTRLLARPTTHDLLRDHGSCLLNLLRNLLWVPNLSQLTRMAPRNGCIGVCISIVTSYLGLISFHSINPPVGTFV